MTTRIGNDTRIESQLSFSVTMANQQIASVVERLLTGPWALVLLTTLTIYATSGCDGAMDDAAIGERVNVSTGAPARTATATPKPTATPTTSPSTTATATNTRVASTTPPRATLDPAATRQSLPDDRPSVIFRDERPENARSDAATSHEEVRDIVPKFVVVRANEAGRDGSVKRVSGSGTVVADRVVVTASHVVGPVGSPVDVYTVSNRETPGRVIAIDRQQDLALVRIEEQGGLEVAVPSKRFCPRPYTPIVTVGIPGRAPQAVVRLGHNMGVDKDIRRRYEITTYDRALLLQLDTRQGESGGPVFDTKGKLAGVIVSTLSLQRGEPLGLSHAIVLPDVAKFVCSHISCNSDWRTASRARITDACI